MTSTFFLSGRLTSNHRLGTTYLKQKKLSSIEDSKLILVGGSNLHYGINSKLLEEKLGIPVVNMGIQGSIGLEYYFNEIMDYVKQDDIVILIAEPAHYCWIDKNGEQPLYNLISKYPVGFRYLNPRQIWTLPNHFGVAINENMKYFLTLIAYKLKGKKTILENTNSWGDYEGHKGKASIYTHKETDWDIDLPKVRSEIAETVTYLNGVEKVIKSKGAHLFIGFAPMAKSAASESDLLSEIYQQVSSSFSATTLGTLTEYIFEDGYFFDTPHHLQFEMRDKRTNMLIENIMSNKTTFDILMSSKEN
jgi:hypothetical protein